MDRRTTPANKRVAAKHLQGVVDAPSFVEGRDCKVGQPLVDLLRAPNGPRDRQLVLGQKLVVYEEFEGWAFVQSVADGYVGYVPSNAVVEQAEESTHRVSTIAGHAYTEPDIKSREAHALYFGSSVCITSHQPKFYETSDGHFIPKPHLRPIDKFFRDPVTVAQMFFGVPYLWGGNSAAGIDCSGLVQAGLLACGLECPGDSDMQANSVGELTDAPTVRGDLLFWDGHVAIAVDETTLIHANAHHMAVTYEPIDNAIRRIEAQGDGPVTARRRLAVNPQAG